MPELINNNDLSDHLISSSQTKEQIKNAMLDITQKYRCRIILTNGGKNILAADKDCFFEVEPAPINIVNSTGSGDAFTAGLAAALLPAINIDDFKITEQTFLAAIDEGIRCGALNAGLVKPGVIRPGSDLPGSE
jgi:fructose-1-phosphate kinase PfkB-like protein